MSECERVSAEKNFPIGQTSSYFNRILTDEEEKKLIKDKTLISTFKQNQLENDACKNWDLFYKRNRNNFFRDRHWTYREFAELACHNLDQHVLLEVGCGCGNLVFPILEENEGIFVYACDFSPRAIDFFKSHQSYSEKRCCAFQCDLTIEGSLLNSIKENSVDIVTMVFVLSAILPIKMKQALENIRKILKPDGVLLFRDYGLYDHAMLRFGTGHKLDENFYVRQDGTRAYYFSLDYLNDLVSSAGYRVLENRYVHKRTVNKKEGIDVPRIFVQGKFGKIS